MSLNQITGCLVKHPVTLRMHRVFYIVSFYACQRMLGQYEQIGLTLTVDPSGVFEAGEVTQIEVLDECLGRSLQMRGRL